MHSIEHLSKNGVEFMNIYEFELVDKDGHVKWVEEVKNLITNVGLDEILDKFYKGSNYSAAHHVGLCDASPTIAAGDTMASHAGWAEVQAYTEGNRQALTLGAVASQSVDNSANKASFSINASATIGGAFIATNNAKGGSGGILIGAAALSSNRAMENGDTLNITVTLTAASA